MLPHPIRVYQKMSVSLDFLHSWVSKNANMFCSYKLRLHLESHNFKRAALYFDQSEGRFQGFEEHGK